MKHKATSKLSKYMYFLQPLAADKKHWKGFRQFLESPLHGNSPAKVELLDHFAAVIGSDGPDAERQLCWAVFPDRDRDDPGTPALLYRRLSPLLQDYFRYEAFCRYQDDEIRQWRYVLHTANEKQWDHYFPWLHRNKTEKVLESLPRSAEYYLHEMDIADQADIFLSRQEQDSARMEGRYQNELQALHKMFSISLLNLACNLRNQSKLIGEPMPEVPLLPALLADIAADPERFDPLILIHYYIYRGLEEQDRDEHYLALETLLLDHFRSLDPKEARRLFQHLTNFWIRRLNICKAVRDEEGIGRYERKILELYEHQLQSRIVFQEVKGEPYIDHGTFINIVVLFSRMGRLEWVENFIANYHPRILKDIREAACDFGLGILRFHQGDFVRARRRIVLVRQEFKESQDRGYAMSVKNYYLRTLFELEEIEDCEREVVNAIKSIRRNEHLMPEEKEKPEQFCHYLQALCRCLGEPEKEKIAALKALRKRIILGPPCSSRKWLMEKIEACLGKVGG